MDPAPRAETDRLVTRFARVLRSRSLWGRVAKGLGALSVGALGATIALQLFPPTRGDVGPGIVEIEARWDAAGRTTLRVPPLGSVTADTHRSPLDIVGRVEQLDLNRVEELAGEADLEGSLVAQAERDIRALVQKFALRTLVGGALAGAVATGLASRLRPALTALGAVGGVLVLGGLLVTTWADYETSAFAQPTYEGPLERAPEVVEAVQRHTGTLDAVRARVEVLALEISELYELAASPTLGIPTDPGVVRLLHVSDIHLNPIGVEVAAQLAATFDVDAVLDTGDLTTFGLPVEAEIGTAIETTGLRWIFVPGNHDSDANREALAAVPNIELLDTSVARVGGVEILGVADPTFTADNETSTDEAREIKRAQAPAVARRTRRERPHILAVHDPVQAQDTGGLAPLVVAGHRHARSMAFDKGTLTLVVGSTGATGLGSFAVEEDLAYEAHVLHLRGGCLVAMDAVSLRGLDGDFELERRSFDFEPDPGGTPRCARAGGQSQEGRDTGAGVTTTSRTRRSRARTS